jgi:hypothetical protein
MVLPGLSQTKKLFQLNFLLNLVISSSLFFHTVCTKAISISAGDIISFFIIQFNFITLAFCNISQFAFKKTIASWAGFIFVLTHADSSTDKKNY